MADDREEFTFTAGSFGDITSDDLIQTGENFLNGEDITPVKKEEVKKEGAGDSKTGKEKKPEVKEVVVPKNEVKEEDIYSILEGKTNEEEEESDDEEEASNNKGTKTPASKQEGTHNNGVEGETEGEEEEGGDSIYTTIAKELVSYGIFSPEEDEEGNALDPQIDSPEEFLERFQVESRRQAADVIDKFLEKF